MPGFFAYKTVVWKVSLTLFMTLLVKLPDIKLRRVRIQCSLLAVVLMAQTYICLVQILVTYQR